MSVRVKALLCGAVACFVLGGESAVELNWIGKEKVVNHHNDVPYHVLEKQWTHGEDTNTENMVIHGDNLLALKSLLPRYEGRIKCIYIDPPYNTGNEGWCYNDNVNDPRIKKWLGEVVGKEGEDFTRHDKWLCMMYPRLKLLQRLLADDGAIFISIDDNELFNLKAICDEVFGLRNLLANFVWYNTAHTDKQEDITNVHEYIICYAKDKNKVKINRVVDPATDPDSKILNTFAENSITKNGRKNPPSIIVLPRDFPCEIESLSKNRHELIDELIKAADENKFITREMTKRYEITYPARLDDMIVSEYKLQHDCRVYSGWMNNDKLKRFIQNDFKPLAEENGSQLRFYLSKNGVIYYRRDGRQQHYIQTVLREVGTTETNKYMLEDMGVVFDFPKPHELITYLLSMFANDGDVILDSFAGSGTTAHAVLNLNKKDGGNRKFILIEMCDYADTITAERVKRVIDGYGEGKNAVEGTGGSFSYYELGPELMKDGVLNEEVGTDKIREYVFYTETKQSVQLSDESYKLGEAYGVAYYFCYEKDRIVTLDRALLRSIKTKAESYVIFADTCTLSAAELERYHITFKKIPRDITRF